MSIKGFTLLELLVAVGVFAIVAAVAWGGLESIARARRVIDDRSASLARLQRAINRFDSDFSAALPRTIRDDRGHVEAALIGDRHKVDVSTFSNDAYNLDATTSAQRVSWECSENKLIRVRWQALDRKSTTRKIDRLMLDGIADCGFSYLAQDGLESERWPPAGSDPNTMPRGIELVLGVDGQGRFTRLIELPFDSGVE